ncbi:MAG: response regulator transcription factor [Thiomicrorhabdus sp.]|nr:response regulator transcription factor [Thiomicrorhabdus sp.]
MKRPFIFIQNPNALKNWLAAAGSETKILYDLNNLDQKITPANATLLIQLSEKANQETVLQLCQQNFNILAFSDHPSTEEGIQLFKAGVKGYLNTHASVERIQKALSTIESGSIWLGQAIMQTMIGQVGQTPMKNNDWKNLLTNRENQVVDQVLNKKSNLEIATLLGITERTVKSHLHNVFEKLHVSDRLGLALKVHNW